MSTPTHVSILLVPGFMLSAYALFTDALRLANWRSGSALFSWDTRSFDDADCVANDGTRVTPTAPLDAQPLAQAAFIAAGFSPELGCTDAVFRWLRALDRAGAVLGGWDTGALILAEAGLMVERRMAVHWQVLPALENRYGTIELSDGEVVAEARRFTAPGGISTFDLALLFISARCGAAVARAVELSANRHVGSVFSARADENRLLPPRVRAAIGVMQERPEAPVAMTEIARLAGASQRSLNREFKESTGYSPAQYYLHLRLGLARDLLRQSDRPILDVALASGFKSASQFSQAFRRHFRLAPREARRLLSWAHLGARPDSARPLIETGSDTE